MISETSNGTDIDLPGANKPNTSKFQSKKLQTLSVGENVKSCPPFVCTGTPKDEVVIGTEVGDMILGLGGINNMRGNGDADVIFGGGNALYGGKEDDHLLGSSLRCSRWNMMPLIVVNVLIVLWTLISKGIRPVPTVSY